MCDLSQEVVTHSSWCPSLDDWWWEIQARKRREPALRVNTSTKTATASLLRAGVEGTTGSHKQHRGSRNPLAGCFLARGCCLGCSDQQLFLVLLQVIFEVAAVPFPPLVGFPLEPTLCPWVSFLSSPFLSQEAFVYWRLDKHTAHIVKWQKNQAWRTWAIQE